MSGITAIQTRGLMKEAATAVDRITNPLKMVTNLEGLPATSTDIVVAALRDLAFPPAIPENLTAGQLTRATNSLAEREKLLWDRVRGGMLDLTKGDTTLSEMMVNSFRGQDFDKQLANVAYLSGVDRADMVSSVEKMQGSLQRQVAQLTGGKSSSLASFKFFRNRGSLDFH